MKKWVRIARELHILSNIASPDKVLGMLNNFMKDNGMGLVLIDLNETKRYSIKRD